MARPKLKEESKKEKISITLPKVFKQAVMERGNASMFVEDTIRLYLQFEDIVKRLSKSKNPPKKLLEELEDVIDSVTINLRREEESVNAEDAFAKILHGRR